MVFPAIKEWDLVTNQAATLVKATDKFEIADLETRFGLSQRNAVTHFIEQTEWGIETFPQFQDRQGSPGERLAALRARWDEWEKLE
jgi:hypothetical protein